MKTFNKVEEVMEIDQNQYDLIKGEFTHEEAEEILMNLVAKKINFHELRSLGKELRFGEKDMASLKRSEELKQTQKRLIKVLEQAKTQGKNLKIQSAVNITLI